MSEAQNTGSSAVSNTRPIRLRDALRQARIEAADRTGVVVDLRDAEVARLEILSDALEPLFAQIPEQVDLFDRGISQGDTPRLWIDVVAHVLMGRDKRIYRFVQDTRFGRIVIAESHEVAVIVDASPSWGSDIGGPPALLPGVILLVLTILQIRLTWRRLLAIGGGIGAFLVILSLLDWLRPTESRSHLGRFVQTTLDGGAWNVIARKVDQNVSLLLSNP